MRRHILHETVYRYHQPVTFGTHRLVIRPREGHDVQVESLSLGIRPAHRISWQRDVFGNSIAWVDFLEPCKELSIRVETILRHGSPISVPNPAAKPTSPYPVTYPEMELPVLQGYLQSVYPAERKELETWVRLQAFMAKPTDAIALATGLNDWIHRHIQYRRREERGVQSPLETLRQSSGSCRDMATLMMEAARPLGLAVRFASGYLDCAASAAGRASTHAWIEIYHPDWGWCGYDPTLNEPTSQKHIVTGVSSHPRGVMPVSGTYHGGSQFYGGMEVTVRLTPA